MTISIGLIGAGNRSKSLLHAMKQTGEFSVAAYVDKEPKTFVEHLYSNAHFYQKEEDLYSNEKIDAVVIATPNDLHEENINKAMENQMAIFTEKPLVARYGHFIDLYKKIGAYEKTFVIGTELRHDPGFIRLKEHINPSAVQSVWCHEFRPSFRAGSESWRLERSRTGGTFLEKNIHHFDLMVNLIKSPPRAVFAKGDHPGEMIENGWVIVEFENGTFGNLGVSLSYEQHHLEVGVLQKDNKFIYYPNEQKLISGNTENAPLFHLGGIEQTGFDHPGEVEQMKEFARLIKSEKSMNGVLEEAYWSHRIAFAAEESVHTGKEILIDVSTSFKGGKA
ncbi:Gfo/Idh/MocA family protein [Halobacillus aidingensis]|uniref:Predicted dehydrogenase n=1 Tax=Halobacillus aidingensis TaxID=240303 RepID=A0A1H0H8S1_HALAD|nr:Gfo/Idh/MocA family oxidoreductase [Halobacillus aidingensis]SDO15535.1 Predicted dehydrogenase [Halobacillus aidingensis]